jgi:hypothetical protein
MYDQHYVQGQGADEYNPNNYGPPTSTTRVAADGPRSSVDNGGLGHWEPSMLRSTQACQCTSWLGIRSEWQQYTESNPSENIHGFVQDEVSFSFHECECQNPEEEWCIFAFESFANHMSGFNIVCNVVNCEIRTLVVYSGFRKCMPES